MSRGIGPAYNFDEVLVDPTIVPPHLQKSTTFFNESGATINVGEVVIEDETGSVRGLGVSAQKSPASTLGAVAHRFLGIASATSLDDTPVTVVSAGLVFAECTAGVVAGNPLTTSAATGHLNLGVAGVDLIIANALEAVSATIVGQALVRVKATF